MNLSNNDHPDREIRIRRCSIARRSRCAPTARDRTVLKMIVLFALAFTSVFPFPASASEKSPPTTYRRWLVPFDRIRDWPVLGGNPVPLKRDLFNQWIELLEKKSDRQEDAHTNTLRRIVLHGRLEGRQIVDGRGFLDFRLSSLRNPNDETLQGRTAAPGNPFLYSIPLDSWGLWIGSPTWEDGSVSIVRTADDEIRLLLIPEEEEDETEKKPPEEKELPFWGTDPMSDDFLEDFDDPAENVPNEQAEQEKDPAPKEPPDDLKKKPRSFQSDRIRFHWSLRSRMDAQGRMQFDLSLPTCTGIELNLDLPSFVVPSTSVGIVMEEPIPEQDRYADPNGPDLASTEKTEYRRWRILLGRHSKATLTIAGDESLVAARQKTGIRQTIGYHIAPQGTEVTAKIFFDKADAFITSLLLDLESPLRLKEILYGEKKVPWTSYTVQEGENASTRVRVNLSEAGKGELRELTVIALAPVRTRTNQEEEASDQNDSADDRLWRLPRVRVVSPNVFWKGTRCGVGVQTPLQVQKLEFRQAVQVAPSATFPATDREVFAFQYFEDDASVAVLLDEYAPRVILSSSVQVQWGMSEITGNMVVDCKLDEGDRYSLEFPVAPNWTIHSVSSHFGDYIVSWDILEEKKPLSVSEATPMASDPGGNKKLVIQLRRPLKPKESLRFQILGRFFPRQQPEFRILDMSPLAVDRRKDESHFIAIRPESPYHLQTLSPLAANLEIRDPLDSRLTERFVNLPMGTILPLNLQTQEVRFRMERLRPNYSAEIEGTVLLKEKEFESSYVLRCQPTDSSVDRVYVFMTSTGDRTDSSQTKTTWTWSGNSDALQPLQTRLLSPSETGELFTSLGSPHLPDGIERGECWEIRLANTQTGFFEIRARLTVPVLSDRVLIPMALLPAASSQRGEIFIDSPLVHPYQIQNSRLKSIPIGAEECYRYEETRAAFRYDPEEELRLLNTPPLALRPISPDDIPPAAWVWSLRMDSQHEHEGIVKNNVVFLLENCGKDSLRIFLPRGVRFEDVHAVWLNDFWISWIPESVDEKTPRYDPPGNETDRHVRDEQAEPSEHNTVLVSLPEGTRFVSVSLEYTYRDVPLIRQQQLVPRYPGADIPILNAGKTAWVPPEFDVSIWNKKAGVSPSIDGRFSRALAYFFDAYRFDPFSPDAWQAIFYSGQRRTDAEYASQTFLNWISAETRRIAEQYRFPEISSGFQQDRFVTENNMPLPEVHKNESKTTWAALFAGERNLIDLLGQADTAEGKPSGRGRRRSESEGIRTRIMIDRRAFTRYGITPESKIVLPENDQADRFGTDILDRNGLVLLVVPDGKKGEYTFYLTSFLMSALHHHFGGEPLQNNVRYLANDSALNPDDPSSQMDRIGHAGHDGNRPMFTVPKWVPANEWIASSDSLSFPWSISTQIIRHASATPDWAAYEISRKTDNRLYLVHHNTLQAYHWLAFLAAIVLTWKRPFSSPVILFPLLVVFEIWARSVAPCYVGVPSGAFFGTVISLGFGLIRSRNGIDMFGRDRYHVRPQVYSNSETTRIRSADLSGKTSSRLKEKSSVQSKTRLDSTGHLVAVPGDTEEHRPDDPARTEAAPSSAGTNRNEPKSSPGGDDSDPGGPPVLFRTILVFCLLFFGLVVSRILYAETPATPPESPAVEMKSQAPISPEPFGPVLSQPESTTTVQEKKETKESREDGKRPRPPYRVFFPVDSAQRPVGNVVFLPEEFYLSLHRHTQNLAPETQHHWSIEQARYEGTLAYHPLTQELTVVGFKAIYDLIVEEQRATIILPPLPLLQDGALWDSSPIQPSWRIRERDRRSEDGDKKSVLVFHVENVKKGRHVLELSLDPKPLRSEESRRVSFEIPKVPGTTLRLNLPTQSPVVNVYDCFGAVSANSLLSPNLTAEIGPSERLTFAWIDEPMRREAAAVDVDSLFWLQARPTPVVIWAKLRYRIDGGKVRHVSLMTDPHWALSGQFHCEEYPIERVETHYEPVRTEDTFYPQGEVTRLVFKSPVSGPLTIRAGFVLRDFTGIGKVRLPQIRPLHARTTRALLAVSADPLLELDLPKDGFGSGFESAWSGPSSLFSHLESRTLPSGSLPGIESIPAPTVTAEEQILAEYDLRKVDPSWTLSIRAKKILPELALTQACRFDFGDSTFNAVGQFTCPQKLFQQSFRVPDSLVLETVEVRDEQDHPVDIRWTLCDPVADTRSGETETSSRGGTIFFRRAVSGTFRIFVSGHFTSVDGPESTLAARQAGKPVPVLSFCDVRMKEHRLEFYRTSAIIAQIETEGTPWVPSGIESTSRKAFPEDLVVGAWRSSLYSAENQGEDDPAEETVRNVAAKKDSPEDVTQQELTDREPRFLILPNRPVIRGETISTLRRHDTTDTWSVTFDILWDITQGELESVRFQWDDRCSILSVEPPVPYSFEQKSGRSQLLLSPKIAFSGKRHIRVKAAMNTSGGAISFPRITPILDRIDQYESENYAVMPAEAEGETIPWIHQMLEAVDEQKIAYLKEQTEKSLEENRPVSLGASRVVVEDAEPGFSSVLSLVGPERESYIVRKPPLIYMKAIGDDFVASIAPKSTRPVVTLYDINMYVRKSGELFGVATFDLKAQGNDGFILALPPQFELIRIVSAGIAVEGTRLMDRHWKIELCAGDYPQRLGILFRGTITLSEKDFSDDWKRRFFLVGRAKERPTIPIAFPTLENVEVRETLWTLSFESETPPPAFYVSTVREEASVSTKEVPPARAREMIESLGQHRPVSGLDAAQTLLKIDLVRLNNLLSTLDSIPNPTPLKMPEVRRWYSQWVNEWNGTVQLIDFQTARFPTALHSDEHSVLLDPLDRRMDGIPGQSVSSFDDFNKAPEASFRAILVRKAMSVKSLGLEDADPTRPVSFPVSTNSLAQYRGRMSENASHLFGATAGRLEGLRLAPVPASSRWSERLLNYKILLLVIPILLLAFSRRFRFSELFMQFPGFWGTAIGLLLWCLFPPGYLGMIVLLLVLLSRLYPVWPKHPEFTNRVRER